MTPFAPSHVSWLAVATMLSSFAASALVFLRARAEASAGGGAKSAVSRLGIVIQGIGFFFAGLGPFVFESKLDFHAVATALLIAGLMSAMIVIFTNARSALGANWSLVARMHQEHSLVTSGPFAYARHPIYAALLLMLLAITAAFSNWDNLLLALPFFAIGTAIRVREEERMLRGLFGQAYDDYAARVKRFVPGIF